MTRIIALVAALALPAAAHAWTPPPIGQDGQTNAAAAPAADSGSAAGAAASATARARSSATGGSATGGSATGGRGGSASVAVTNNSGSGRQVATAAAPAVLSVNPCLPAGNSGAVQTGVFGLSLGLAHGYDEVCRLHVLGEDAAARAYLCRADADVRQAYKDIGQPCPQDAPPPLVIVISRPAGKPPRTVYPYDYCQTRSAGDRNQHRECGRPRTE
jgi:hypothetical protein